MQLDFLLFLQKISNPILNKIFISITNLGSETFYVLSITLVYWCINKKLGIKLFIVSSVSGQVNLILKNTFKTSRPINVKGIKPLFTESAPGYSFPSGHTQNATTFWYYLIKKVNERKFTVLGLLLISLIGFSRLYLRVHWPIDVIGGIIIGILLVYIIDFFIENLSRMKLNFLTLILLAIIIPNTFILIFKEEKIIKLIALITSTLIGFTIENRFIRFSEKNSLIYQIIKYICGISILYFIKVYFKLILPSGNLSDYIRYFCLGLWITLIYPIVIKLFFNSYNSNKSN